MQKNFKKATRGLYRCRPLRPICPRSLSSDACGGTENHTAWSPEGSQQQATVFLRTRTQHKPDAAAHSRGVTGLLLGISGCSEPQRATPLSREG